MPASRIVGIDLGTTHTVVAWAGLDRDAPPGIFEIRQLVSATEVEARPLLPSCLYAPAEGEAAADPWGDAPWILGEHARRRGTEVPGRLVASAKSWLCHPGVDREAAILPWGADDASPRLSPVDAATRCLAHVRRVWDETFPAAPLPEQEIVLTVPASFDQVARELTLDAARRAGLPVRLLEEPQAAFYDYLHERGGAALEALVGPVADAEGRHEALVMVCDVGGGTTDLSLIKVSREGPDAPLGFERIAVGSHLLLGGDNMDLALAHLCERRLVPAASADAGETRLDPRRFAQLVLACRSAKERLLAEGAPDEVTVTLLGAGSRLLGGALSTQLGRAEVEALVLDGFLPLVARDARPQRSRSALHAFGLPYEKDVAITRHLAWFFARHAPGEVAPRALLLNGGVFRSPRIASRIAEAVRAWGGPPLSVLPHADPDLAVARGAVAYGLSLRGRGARIQGGAPRGYYVGLDAVPGAPRRAICVVPRGAEEGKPQHARGRTLALLVGRHARFDLFASDDAAIDAPGDVVTLDDERFQPLPPITTRIRDAATGPRSGGEVRVELEGELTAIGTLDLACVEVDVAPPLVPRRFRLAFQLREPAERSPGASEPPRGGASLDGPQPASRGRGGKREQEAVLAIDKAFGGSAKAGAVDPRDAKNLSRELERLLGERTGWTTELARGLADALLPNARNRRRSPDHERVFWSLAGFCLRPGFGDPGDPARIERLGPLFGERLAFPAEMRSWQQFWIAWRRVAGGLDEVMQTSIRDVADPFLAPSEVKLKRPKPWKPEALDLLLELASSLERVAPARRSELGGWVLERTWTDRDPRLWAAVGRVGARVPAYASVHHVVAPQVAERFIDHLLREKWAEVPTAAPAAVALARVTGDRARDVSERVRREVERRLTASNAREAWVQAVRELVSVEEADRAAFYGEALPVGLRLVD